MKTKALWLVAGTATAAVGMSACGAHGEDAVVETASSREPSNALGVARLVPCAGRLTPYCLEPIGEAAIGDGVRLYRAGTESQSRLPLYGHIALSPAVNPGDRVVMVVLNHGWTGSNPTCNSLFYTEPPLSSRNLAAYWAGASDGADSEKTVVVAVDPPGIGDSYVQKRVLSGDPAGFRFHYGDPANGRAILEFAAFARDRLKENNIDVERVSLVGGCVGASNVMHALAALASAPEGSAIVDSTVLTASFTLTSWLEERVPQMWDTRWKDYHRLSQPSRQNLVSILETIDHREPCLYSKRTGECAETIFRTRWQRDQIRRLHRVPDPEMCAEYWDGHGYPYGDELLRVAGYGPSENPPTKDVYRRLFADEFYAQLASIAEGPGTTPPGLRSKLDSIDGYHNPSVANYRSRIAIATGLSDTGITPAMQTKAQSALQLVMGRRVPRRDFVCADHAIMEPWRCIGDGCLSGNAAAFRACREALVRGVPLETVAAPSVPASCCKPINPAPVCE